MISINIISKQLNYGLKDLKKCLNGNEINLNVSIKLKDIE